MVTYSEWIELAEQYERKAREYYDRGDIALGEMYENKANACRACASYGSVEDKEES